MKNKDIYLTNFKLEPDNDQSHRCLHCDAIIHQNIKKGYTNVVNHIQNRHPDLKCDVVAAEAYKQNGGDLTTFYGKKVNAKASNMFRWMQWVVMGDQPFNIVENQWVRKNTNVDHIGRKSLMSIFKSIHNVIKDKIKKNDSAKIWHNI
jgi:hypothetical protein